MGFFDSIGSAFSSAVKGVKSAGEKAVKGVKRGGEKFVKGAKRAGFNKNFGRDFKRGFGMTGRALQAPMKWVEKNDPIAKKMGDFGGFSPITLGSSIALGIPTSVGYLEELAVDKKKQKKIREGDADEIMNLGFAGLGLVPMGSGAGGAAKSGGRAVARGASKGVKGMAKAFSRFGSIF